MGRTRIALVMGLVTFLLVSSTATPAQDGPERNRRTTSPPVGSAQQPGAADMPLENDPIQLSTDVVNVLFSVTDPQNRFVGNIEQIPPMVSAVKIDGKRLHELARKGIEVDRPPRPVTVYRYDVEPTDDPLVYRAFVDCSSGTYVRVLAADLGHALGGGAHLRKLRRTSVGAFTLADATSLEDVTVIPMAEAVRGFPIVRVDEATEAAIRVGAVLDSAALGVAGTGPWPILSPTGELLAMYEPFGDGRVKPVVVLVG